MVEDDHVGSIGCTHGAQFLQFPVADERGWIQPVAHLQELAHNFAAGAAGQLSQLGKRFLGAKDRSLRSS